MRVDPDDARDGARRLAAALLRDVNRLAERCAERMHALVPSYARVPREQLLPALVVNVRNMLETVREPDADCASLRESARVVGNTRARQGISSHDMLHGWRIGLDVVREEAHVVASELGFGSDVLLEFIEATLSWGDIGMRATTATHHAAEVSELSRLVHEQAALRRVATLVARGESAATVLQAVAEELGAVLRAPAVSIVQNRPGGAATIRAGSPTDLASTLTVPIVATGGPWGAIVVSSAEPLRADTGSRVAAFADLVATAITNANARAEAKHLTDEQAALRRVATQVAQRVPPRELFASVAREVGILLGADRSDMVRYEADQMVSAVATWAAADDHVEFKGRWPLGGGDLSSQIARRRAPVRIDDWSGVRGEIATFVRERTGLNSSVGAPIVVDGRLWGALLVHLAEAGPLPADTEEHLQNFTDLVATAVSDVQAHSDLEASRSRIAVAGHEERRRVARDLHDGAQQRLVHTVITLKLAQRALDNAQPAAAELVAEALEHAGKANVELRELAHGIMPAALTSRGLGAGVDALASRMRVPVHSDVSIGRLPADIEATAYFVVAEALTNASKHAHAAHVDVMARLDDHTLHIRVSDDGVGAARADGSGLVGLSDRLAAVNGRLRVASPPGRGTAIEAWIPVPELSG
jgi:signal transduction histidine kinase